MFYLVEVRDGIFTVIIIDKNDEDNIEEKIGKKIECVKTRESLEVYKSVKKPPLIYHDKEFGISMYIDKDYKTLIEAKDPEIKKLYKPKKCWLL